MRVAIVFAFFAFVFGLVGALPGGLNAQRMAEGLPPLPPVRRAPTRAALAARQRPSGVSQCNTGPVQCCNSVTTATSPGASLLISLLGITGLSSSSIVGLSCSPVLLGGNSCSSQTVCCQNNNFNGLVAVGCTPVSINL